MRLVRSRYEIRGAPFAVWLLAAVTVFGAGCFGGEEGDPQVEVEVRDVAFDRSSGSPMVVLEDKDHEGQLPMLIGAFEAQAIVLRLRGMTTPRPLTHDLMTNILRRMGAVIDRVLIEDLRDNTYYAKIYLRDTRQEMVEIDSRPSDAIALALRFDKPIYVARRLLQSAKGAPMGQDVRLRSEQLLGAEVQDLTPELAEYFGTRARGGALVSRVGDPRATELRRGDVILKLNGEQVRDAADLKQRLEKLGDEESAELEVERDGRRTTVTAKREG